MKNLVRICSFLTLLVAFSFVSANAQTVQRYEADIPFAFSVGAKTYAAGTYVMRLSNAPIGKMMTLEDGKNKVLKTFYVMERGDAPAKNSFLRFINSNDGYALARISTSEKSFSVNVPKSAKNSGSATFGTQTVSLNLK